MVKPNSDGNFDKVLFSKVMADDHAENGELSNDEDDIVHLERKSLIPENKLENGFTRRSKTSRRCNIQRFSKCVLFFIGITLFFVGLVIGLMIGRFSFHSNQSESSTSAIVLNTQQNTCNCSKLVTEEQTPPSIQTPPPPVVRCTTTDEQTTQTVTKLQMQSSQTSKITTSSKNDKNCNVCKTRDPVESLGEEYNTSLFAPLTKGEMKKVTIAMRTKGYVSYDRTLGSNILSHIYLHPPVKAQALQHLDDNGLFPGRFAKLHVFRPRNDPPDVMEYRVGPLNETFENMIVEQLREDGEISFNRRPYNSPESIEIFELISQELKEISRLLYESFDGASPRSVRPDISHQPTSDLSDRTSLMVLSLRSVFDLLPVSCIVHHPGINISRWYTTDWYYLDQGPYKSAADLQEAYDLKILRRIEFPTNYRKLHKFDFHSERNISLPERDLSDIPPPRTYEPEGPRYTIIGNKIKWMGWQFELSSNTVRGPAIFDVRFQGERIAYEISLQDITLLYSSQTNGHGPPVLSDTFYLIGKYNKPILDVDCPKRSTILRAATFLSGSPITMDAFCVFEADGQRPVWRHGSGGLADHYLVVRAPINVGNYDYLFEWNFLLDGRLKTRLTASGYLYGAFWDPEDPMVASGSGFTPFGYRLGKYLLGPIHDHTFSFKIDLDILGTKNSFQTVHWKAGSTLDAFRSESKVTRKPGYIFLNNTRYINSELLEHEDSFIVDTKHPKIWTVVNENRTNAWGAKRGYKVIPSSNYAEILESHMMLEVWDHLKYQLAVSKRRDSEPFSSNSLYYVTHPIKMTPENDEMKLDNENIRDEDLVLWISEKFYHVPTSEDMPVTLPVEAGFTLKPYNYFDRTPVFDLPAHYSSHVAYNFKPCFVND